MKSPQTNDIVLLALKTFKRLTEMFKYGGMFTEWKLANEALAEYKKRTSIQPGLFDDA